jgi:hypothetical protein
MIVDLVDIEGVRRLKAKDDPPVTRYVHGPETSEITFQRMPPKAWGVDFLYSSGRFQPLQNAPGLVRLIGSDFAAIALLEQALQIPVPETPYHAMS